MALGDGVEGAVAQAQDTGLGLVGLVAALAQQPLEVGRVGRRGGDLAAERFGGRWRSGTAQLLPDEDPYARLRMLRRPVNDALLLAVGTEQLVVRIDLAA